MTTQEIVGGLTIPINSSVKKHAAGIAAIYNLFEKERTRLLSANVVDAGKILFGCEKITERGKVVNEFEAKTFTAETSRGKYSFTIPLVGLIYQSFCKLLNIKYDEMKKQNTQEKPLLALQVPAEFANCLQEAKAFVSKDQLRPALGCILIEVEKDHVRIIATDAHRLYMSRKFKIPTLEKKQPEFLITATDLPKKLEASEPFELVVTKDHISFLEKDFKLFDGKFPQYKVVVPEYDRYVVFNRKDLIQAVKQTLTYSNKGSHMVSFLIKDQIELAGQDVDFSNEASVRLNWIEKTVRDMAISFDGKLLISVLESFDTNTLKVYTDGSSKKAGIFTDGKDRVLLMPQMDANLKVSYLSPERYSQREVATNRPIKDVPVVVIDKEILELEKEFSERFVFDKAKDGTFAVLVIDEYPKEVNIRGVKKLAEFKTKLKEWEKNNPAELRPEDAPAPKAKRKKAVEDDEEMVVTSSGKLEKRKKAWLTDAVGLSYEKWLPYWVRFGRLEKAKETGNVVRKERLINQSKNTYNKYLKATN